VDKGREHLLERTLEGFECMGLGDRLGRRLTARSIRRGRLRS
jgi:hypothetical protein